MLTKLKQFVTAQWNRLPDSVKRAIHTFWQTFLAVFLAGVTGIVSSLAKTHNLADAETALVALVVAAVASAFSVAKSQVLSVFSGSRS